MNVHDAIRTNLTMSQKVVQMLLGDLSDADLLVRPVPGANHTAWQLGHVIVSEHNMLTKHVPGAAVPELPPGFAEQHGKEGAAKDTGFRSKEEYLGLFNKVRQATVAALGKLSDKDLDKPTGWEFAPTLGAMMVLIGNHMTMHSGQFSVVRRKIGKPVVF